MCSRRLFALLCVLLLALPVFCGWDAFRNYSDGSFSETVFMEAKAMDTEPQGKSLTVVSGDTNQTDGLLKSYEESSKNYEDSLTAVGESLDGMRQTKAVEEAKALVQELERSKAALEENYAALADTVKEQERIIRKETGVHWGVGLSLGYRQPQELSPGIDLQMRASDWILRVGLDYAIPVGGPLQWDAADLGYEVGVMYEF